MKKIDEDKINAVGQTLGVGLSDTMQTRRQKLGRIIFRIIQGLIAFGSALLGVNFGMNYSSYPYFMGIEFGKGFFFETAIQAGNAIIILPKEQRFGFSHSRRVKIFLGNLILSFALFAISFGILSKWGPTPSSEGPVPEYGIYDNNYSDYDKSIITRRIGSERNLMSES